MIRKAVRLGRAAAVLRACGAAYGQRPNFEGHAPQISMKGKMTVGDFLIVRGVQLPIQITVRQGATLTIGDWVFINQGANILASSSVTIGDHSKIADFVGIRDTDTHEVDPWSGVATAPVVIGRNVWVGRGALILPGVEIGANSVVAAGAVVTRNVPENTVVGGIPAKTIRTFAQPDPGWVRS